MASELPPPSPPPAERRLAAVWFADVVGFTVLSERNEEAALRLVAEFQVLARREVEKRSGRVVKFVGDGVLAVFESAGAALEAALAFRDAFHRSSPAEAVKARLRIGLHVGEIFTAPDGDVFGDGVNTASRIQGAAAPGQVLLSEFALESVRHRTGFRVVPKGKRRLKGLGRSFSLYAVGLEGEPDPFLTSDLPPAHPSPLSRGQAVALGMGAAITALVGLGILFGAFGNQDPERGPQGEETEVALGLGIEAYYRGDLEEARRNLSLFLKPAGSLSQRRQGLRYLARSAFRAGDTMGAEQALKALLATEDRGPLALLIPSVEDPGLMELYYEARRTRLREEGRHRPSRPVRKILMFDFQVFGPSTTTPETDPTADAGYVAAFMLQTELALAGLPVTSVREMSFGGRGDEAYLDLERALLSPEGEAPSHLLTGSLALAREGVLLSAWLYEMETGRLVAHERVTGSLEDLLVVLPEEMAHRLARAVSRAAPSP